MRAGAGGGWTRRRVLGASLGGAVGLAAAGAGALELVARGVLPGQQVLNRLDGACSVPDPPLAFATPGPSVSGSFYSRARRQPVSLLSYDDRLLAAARAMEIPLAEG